MENYLEILARIQLLKTAIRKTEQIIGLFDDETTRRHLATIKLHRQNIKEYRDDLRALLKQ